MCKSKMFLSFVLAAYNEEENVLPLMDQITQEMRNILSDYEVVFVIEGKDQTYPILQQYQQEHPQIPIKLIYQAEPRGLTSAFKTGFENVSPQTTHVVTMDVDLNHKPEELSRFLPKAKEGYNIVIGSRALAGSAVNEVPLWKRAVSKIANTVFNKAFKINVKDKTSGYRMIDIGTIKEIAPLVQSRNFEGLMEFLLIANKKGKKIAEVPITLTYRQHGDTKFKLFHAGKGYVKLLLNINRR